MPEDGIEGQGRHVPNKDKVRVTFLWHNVA